MSDPRCATFREMGLTCAGWNDLTVINERLRGEIEGYTTLVGMLSRERDQWQTAFDESQRELSNAKQLHEIAKGFHDVAVKERDYQRLKNDRLRREMAEARELLIEWRELRGAPLILASLTDTWLAASSEPPQSAPARAPATSPPR